MGLSLVGVNPIEKVSARADGHYFVGHYDAEVSEYLNVRKYADVNSISLARIPANATFYVEEVVGHMGRVVNYKLNGRDYELKDSKGNLISGWVNLEYADENYAKDGGAVDMVPDGSYICDYWSVDWISLRSEPNTYSYRLAKLYPGEMMQRFGVENEIMGGCHKYIDGTPMQGWINLDYTAFRRWL